jgi:hypothetical protein
MIRFILGLFGALAVFYRLALRMAKYGFADLKIEVDNSGGSPIDMSTYITSINGFSIEAILEEITSAGDADERWAAVGVSRAAEIVFGGAFDDTVTTGPDAIFNALGDTREIKFTYGGSKTSTFEAIIRRYDRSPAMGELTKFEVALQPTGAIVEA